MLLRVVVLGPTRPLDPQPKVFIFQNRVLQRGGWHTPPRRLQPFVSVVPAEEHTPWPAKHLGVRVQNLGEPPRSGLGLPNDEERREAFRGCLAPIRRPSGRLLRPRSSLPATPDPGQHGDN